MSIKIKYGNLVKEKSTFIVNASNTELILGSGVSKAFRKRCGGIFFQQELYKIKGNNKINQGYVVVSDSGIAKNFKYTLHVAVMNYTDDNKSAFPNYNQIKQSLKKILQIIEEKVRDENINNPKLVIPLLGCGTGGLKATKVFLLIKQAFQKSNINLDTTIFLYNKKDYIRFMIKEFKIKYCT